MKIDKIYEVFRKIEEDKSLMDLFEIDGTNSWVHVKFEVYKAHFILNQINKGKGIRLKHISMLIIHFFRIFRYKNRKNLFFGLSRGIVKINNQNFENVYLMKEHIDPNNVKLFLTLNSYNEINQNKSYLNKEKVVFDNVLYSFYKIVFGKLIKPKSVDFSTVCTLFYDAEININNETINKIHIDFFLRYKFYSWLIKKYKNVTNAYIVSAYSKSSITAALKRRNIHVAEIQHGLIGKVHYGYNFYCDINDLPLVDSIYVYNDFWKKEMEKCNFAKNIFTYKYYKYQNIFPSENKIGFDYILFTGQGLLYEEIVNFLSEGVEFLRKNNLKLIYKPHPAENIDNCPIKELSNRSSEIIFNNYQYSTEYMIKYAKAHISIQSSCHFDAVEIIGKTHIANFSNIENNVLDFVKSNPENFIAINTLSEISIKK